MIRVFFFFNGVASTDIYTLSLHDALPILKGEIHREGGERASPGPGARAAAPLQRRLDARSEEHTSELQSHSDLVCRLLLEKKNRKLLIWMPKDRPYCLPLYEIPSRQQL